jgi:hypothetical protein
VSDISAAEERAVETERALLHQATTLDEWRLPREVIRKVARLLQLAYIAFDREEYEGCHSLCDAVLLIDPDYPVARELRSFTELPVWGSSTSRSRVDEWKRQTDDDETLLIPSRELFHIPDADLWIGIVNVLALR